MWAVMAPPSCRSVQRAPCPGLFSEARSRVTGRERGRNVRSKLPRAQRLQYDRPGAAILWNTGRPAPGDGMKTLVLLRHGESTWNKENRFTGWTDVGLTEKGVEEARAAGVTMLKAGYAFDVAYTSVLKRAIKTLWLALEEMDLMWIPIENSWELNERHYGALQGLNKRETVEKHGEEQVQIWRRGYDTRPPALSVNDERAPLHDPRYRSLPRTSLPLTESLKDTV